MSSAAARGGGSSSASSNYNLRNLVDLLRRFYNGRSSSSALSYSWRRSNNVASSSAAGSNSSSMVAHNNYKQAPAETTKQIRGLQLISCNSLLLKGRLFLHNSAVDNKSSAAAGAPPSSLVPASLPQPKYNFTGWVKWALGAIFTIVLPFWKQRWERMKTIEREAEMVAGEMEKVTEVVEKVATVAENMSVQLAENLPPTNEKLKETALVAERIFKTTAHDAHVARDFLHQVDKLAHDFDDLEKMVHATQPKPCSP